MNLRTHYRARSAAETEGVGEELATGLRGGDVVFLEGDLAAGKTAFVRGIVRGLGGEEEAVSSPTFVLIQTYDCDSGDVDTLHHVDLYRLDERARDLREIGVEEILSDRTAVIAVEWPKDVITGWIPGDTRLWRITITVEDDDARSIVIIPP